jgi:hypothetical protein
MAFEKTSTPQPFKVASTLCEICGKKAGILVIDGKLICEDCQKQKESEIKNV